MQCSSPTRKTTSRGWASASEINRMALPLPHDPLDRVRRTVAPGVVDDQHFIKAREPGNFVHQTRKAAFQTVVAVVADADNGNETVGHMRSGLLRMVFRSRFSQARTAIARR